MMRTPLIGAALAAVALVPIASEANAQSRSQREYNEEVRQAQREYQRDLRNADNARERAQARREYNRALADARRDYRGDRRQDVRDWRQYRNYDYNRYERGYTTYYADRYYRDGSYYQPRTLGYNDRIYAGQNGRYYCRRSDGTTGLIVGGIAGGALGAALTSGRSEILGVLLGAGAGAALGNSIDRNNVRCR